MTDPTTPQRPYVHPYIPNTAPAVKQQMLDFIGVSSIEEFYTDIPVDLRLDRPLDLPAPMRSEQELVRHVDSILSRNRSIRERLSFLGGGTYDHYVPAVVDEVIGRSEFLTAYAGEPYEDHGRFQALFEYQSLMAELLEMDVVNVPTYDGFQAAATAIAMSQRITQRNTVLVASDVAADKRSKVADFNASGLDIIDIPTKDGTVDVDALAARLDDRVAAVWIETPSAFGALEQNIAAIAALAHDAGAVLVAGTDPIMTGVIAPPGAQGADIVYGDIQSLGLHPYFGGSHGGFIALHDDPRFVMELPSRLFGIASTVEPGEYGFGDVAYDRTSFAHREDGKEWVGTAAALWGIAAGVYISLHGPEGMAELGRTILANTRYAEQRLAAIGGVTLSDDAIHFREFCVEIDDLSPNELIDALHSDGIDPGIPIDDRRLLVCVTEQHSANDIDRLAAAIRTVVNEKQGATR